MGFKSLRFLVTFYKTLSHTYIKVVVLILHLQRKEKQLSPMKKRDKIILYVQGKKRLIGEIYCFYVCLLVLARPHASREKKNNKKKMNI